MKEIEGAQAEYNLGTTPIQAIAQKNEDGSLPMLVWLRGDEDFFAEFDLSADEAMEQLGIKRSRLNQISGKELRFGRTRIGRYIRPVYRSQDVDEYLNWSRATSTHKKSATALEQAIQALEDQEANLRRTLESDRSFFLKEQKRHLEKHLSEAERLNKSSLDETKDELVSRLRQIQSQYYTWMKNQFSIQKESLEQTHQFIENHSFDPSLVEDMHLSLQLMRSRDLEAEKQRISIQSEVNQIHKAFLMQQKTLDFLIEKSEEGTNAFKRRRASWQLAKKIEKKKASEDAMKSKNKFKNNSLRSH